ncbi:hypothetical protein PF007_g13742 [Phytophthora fragariae]|uniref:Uncharacterized protein n=1 Tax=Phytophthora fragariae TaxID=53985 RepID=A0A6A4DCE7_9STRA|nr:hypothetical protein PF009_g14640 [Phytophthora fragariae]KAE9105332.1 hypothetical protein PF007_g13742 [Phytophthora fragariae]KAE9303728.1 hypothetical protein PF001_g13418 [Phytophthora fragariae]KAE9339886.1 hypothetical protein PF008_g11359 [Phytophthora fragariae]
MTELNNTVEVRLVKVMQYKIQEKCDDGSLKGDMVVLSQVDDLVNSWMLDIVHRKIREEATKSDMASDTVCCVQLKVEARLATGFLAQR